MNVTPTIKAGDFIRMPDNARSIWYVERVSACSAHIMPVTGKPRAITTRKGVTKMVVQRSQGQHIAATAYVDILTPEEVAQLGSLKEKVMAEGDKQARQGHVYVRTEKESKGMKGQGAIILDAIEKLGQATVADVVKATTGQYTTRQPEERVVGFYMSKFKREGLVKDITAQVAADAKAEAEVAKQAESETGEIEG